MVKTSGGQARVSKHKILVVDDHPIVQKGLAQLIAHEPDIELCGGADNVRDALDQVEALRPDLVVVDISLKESHGMELIRKVKARYGDVKMLVWSMFDEKVFAERALRAGAMGYIDKQKSIETVVDAIRQVLRGEMYLSRRTSSLLLRRLSEGEPLEEEPVRHLTDRQLEIFEMIGKGMTTRHIARNLDLSPKTVENHRERIKTKLDLKNAAELTQRAIQWVLENG